MDESEFWKTNRPLLFIAIKGLWAPGWTIDDLINEARYGLWQAHQTWNPDKGMWYSYALLVARRRVIELVVRSTRQKHKALTSYSDLESSGCYDMPDIYEINDSKEIVMKLLSQVELTKIEQSVIELWLLDYRYKEIAEHLGVTYKMVDNAYQRVLKKLRKISNSDTRDFSFLP